jgi:hypothetical protein
MKKFLMCGCAGILCFGLSGFYKNAHAQFAQESTQLLSWAKQVKDMGSQLQQLYQNYQMAQNTWNSLHNARDVSSMLSAVGSPVRRFLPEAGDLISTGTNGARLVQGAGSIRSANQLFSAIPQATRSAEVGATWLDEMNRRETTTANVQATADMALQDIQNRMANLSAMQARIAVSPDAKDIADVSANIEVEKQNLALHSASLQALQLKLAVADRAETTRREQFEAQGAKRWADATRSAVDNLQGP